LEQTNPFYVSRAEKCNLAIFCRSSQSVMSSSGLNQLVTFHDRSFVSVELELQQMNADLSIKNSLLSDVNHVAGIRRKI